MREIKYNNLKWIDIFKPSDKDIEFLKENFDFHHILLGEIKNPTYHPLLESYGQYLFLILHFPNLYRRGSQIQAVEMDILITKDALITVRYQDFQDFEEIFTAVEKRPELYMNKTTGHLLHFVVKSLFSKMFPELDKIKELLDKIEDKIFKHFGDDIIEGVAHVKRQILDFIRALKPQKAVWDSAHDVMTNFWGEGLKPYVSDVVADYNRMVHFTDIHREVADSLHVTSSSLLDNRRNYVIKILTVFTAILLPLSLVASIYGMNLKYLPFADNPYAFWWFFGGMLTTTIVSVTLLKKNKWL